MLTKVPRDEDVVDTALASGVIMWVVWWEHSSLWTCEVTTAGSCGERRGSNTETVCKCEPTNSLHLGKWGKNIQSANLPELAEEQRSFEMKSHFYNFLLLTNVIFARIPKLERHLGDGRGSRRCIYGVKSYKGKKQRGNVLFPLQNSPKHHQSTGHNITEDPHALTLN